MMNHWWLICKACNQKFRYGDRHEHFKKCHPELQKTLQEDEEKAAEATFKARRDLFEGCNKP